MTDKENRKFLPLYPHGDNSFSGLALGFGHGLALGFGLDKKTKTTKYK
jgi:hypothetical protein